MVDWDKRYLKRDGPLYGDAPNEYVREILARSDFAARSALMLADGDGRNGRFLAKEGLAVTAVDLSEVATERATAADRVAGVTVERIKADLGAWQPPAGKLYESVFLIYLHCDPPTFDRALKCAMACLTPRGWLVMEGFGPRHERRNGMGPSDPAFAYHIDEMLNAADGYEVVEALEGRVLLAEGEGHRGEGRVARLALRRPA
ncbi:MAG: class I SAM-dependent methyltransferase [Hyphomicrobiaceae bacterium]